MYSIRPTKVDLESHQTGSINFDAGVNLDNEKEAADYTHSASHHKEPEAGNEVVAKVK